MHEEELHPRFAGPIRGFAARRSDDPDTAEDVAQETLRRVLAALRAGRVRDHASLPSFVFGTAHRVCAVQARSAARRRRAFERVGADADPLAPDDPLGELLSRERAAAVRRALLRLPDDDRALLRRFFYDDAEADEVAGEMGITPGAARVRKHRALRRLGEILGDADGGGAPGGRRGPRAEETRRPAKERPAKERPARELTAPASMARVTPARRASRERAPARARA